MEGAGLDFGEGQASAPTPFRAHRVLSRRPDASRARQEHAVDASPGLQAERRCRDRRPSATRRPAPSVRVAPSRL